MSHHDRRLTAGFTLIEMTCSIILLVGFLALSQRALLGMVRELGPNSALSDRGVVLDMVCDRLRRDLTDGAVIEGDTLIAGGARWRTDGVWLTRNGANRLSGCTIGWRIMPDGAAIVDIAQRSATAGRNGPPLRTVHVHPRIQPRMDKRADP